MSGPRLSILICTLPERANLLARLRRILDPQCRNQPVEVLLDERPRPVSIGAKRNALLQASKGDYIAFVDDDDKVSATYVHDILRALRGNPDCSELWGIITFDGRNPKKFHHFVGCTHWHEKNGVYLRGPNHLSPVRRELALKAGFPDNSFGEDHAYSDRLLPLLKNMGACPRTLYFYDYRSAKPEMK